jgi:hypothetical protein
MAAITPQLRSVNSAACFSFSVAMVWLTYPGFVLVPMLGTTGRKGGG